MMLQWPPRTKREMKAWQNQYGFDTRIAEITGVAVRSIAKRRTAWGVPPLRKPGRPPKEETVGGTDEKKIAALYGDRRYNDVRLSKKRVVLL